MQVAICQIQFLIFDCHSLKDKRSVVCSLKERIRQKFNVSIAEITEHENYQMGFLGVAIVSNDRRHLEQVFTKVINLISSDERVEIIKQLLEFG